MAKGSNAKGGSVVVPFTADTQGVRNVRRKSSRSPSKSARRKWC